MATDSDVARFDAVFRACHRSVLGYALRRTDPDTADEVVSETFLVVWRRLEDVPASNPTPWTLGIARKVLANQYRSDRRRRALIDRAAATTPRSEVPGPDGSADLDHGPVLQALARLSERDREILRLHAWDDLTTPEIATALGVSATTAAVRLHRARKRLRRALEEVRDHDQA